MLGITASSELHAKATAMVESFSAQVAREPSRTSKKQTTLELSVKTAMDQLFISAAEYCQARRLSIIGRARFAKALQRELYRHGFAADIVTKVTTAVILNALVAPGKTE